MTRQKRTDNDTPEPKERPTRLTSETRRKRLCGRIFTLPVTLTLRASWARS